MGIIKPIYESLLHEARRLGRYIRYRTKHAMIEDMVVTSSEAKKGGVKGSHSIWNPAKSDKLERTLESLVELYRSGKIELVLRPTTLAIDLSEYSGDYRGLYNAAFVRTARPQWAEEIFPGNEQDASGFQSLVDELNSRLQDDGITVKNIKQVKTGYVSHSHREIEDILNMSKEVREGTLDSVVAIERLEKEFEISLSDSQKISYFGTKRFTGDKYNALDGLIRKISITGENMGIDLSDVHLLKGLLFESLVGVFLVDKYGRDSVTPQKRLPISYRDLSGGYHSSVFIDFLVDGNIYEIKWENNLDNILNSVLAQVYAVERDSDIGMRSEFAHVICRYTNPQILTHFNENIFLDKEAKLMDLDEGARNIQDLFTYTAVEDLVGDHKNRNEYMKALKLMDEVIEEGDKVLIKNYTKALMQIYMNGDEVPEKLGFVKNRVLERRPFSNVEIFKIFGPKKVFEAEQVDLERRLEIIRKERRKFYTNFLLEMYNLRYGTNYDAIADEVVADVQSWSEDEFIDYNKRVLENRKKSREERIGKKRAKSVCYVDNIIEQQEKAYQRARRDNLRKIELFGNYITDLVKRFRDRYDENKKRFSSLSENQPANAVILAYKFLKRRRLLNVDFGEYNQQANAIDDCFDQLRKLQDHSIKKALNILQTYFGAVKESGLKVPRELGDVIREAEEHLDYVEETFVDAREQMCKMDVYQAFIQGPNKLGSTQIRKSKSRKRRKEKNNRQLVLVPASKDEYTVIKGRSMLLKGWELKYLCDCYKLLFHVGRNLAEVTQWGAAWFLNNSINHIAKNNEEMSDTAAFLSIYQLPYDLEKVKSSIMMEGYTLDNIERMLNNENAQKEYVNKEFITNLSDLQSAEQGMHLSSVKEWLKVYSKQMREVTGGNVTENLRALYEINLWDGGKIHSKACDILYGFLEENKSKEGGEGAAYLEKFGEPIFKKLEEGEIIIRRLITDYYGRKIYNAKVLSYIKPKVALKYLRANRISPSMSSKPTNEFATHILRLKQQDNKAFQKYCTALRQAS